jgi:cellulose synthase/poly-beta-1,6-N-acetylglucosamine synthase-like glycosyltransferase
MIYDFFNHIFTRYPVKTRRLFEVSLPLVSLFVISSVFWGAFLIPSALAYFILFFDIFWLYKSFNLALYSLVASKRIREAETADWLAAAEKLEDFEKVYHLVIIPTYKESIEKLRRIIESIKMQTFPAKRIFVFVAFEQREQEARQKAEILSKDYKDIFGLFYCTFHPDSPNEVRGKSSNQAYAARIAQGILTKHKEVNLDYLTVTSADADSVFDRQYFSCLAYKFLSSSSRYERFWQSANVHYNNFWQIPSLTRVIVFFGNLWRTSILAMGLRLIVNSTYSLSFKLLKEIGYWDTDVIPEDYRIFFKAFFAKKGRVEVEPIYLKTSMDAPLTHGFVKSILNKYTQERRWSWGIADDVNYIRWYLTVPGIPFLKKTYIIANVLLDHILWPVNWFIITISANIVVFLNPVFYRTTLGYNLTRLSGFILTLCLSAIFAMIFVDANLQKSMKHNVSRLRRFLFLPEFVFLPIAGFFLSTLPALISHVQLILGKKLEYKVTEKI